MKKIGRNDLCPCGSGKKFKHCHLGNEDELLQKGNEKITYEASARITDLATVTYGRSREFMEAIDIKALTGSEMGVKFIDLKQYGEVNMFGQTGTTFENDRVGGVVVNILKTKVSDPNNIYVAISPKVGDSTLIHQLAHVLDYLGGSNLMPGLAKPLSFELGIPTEHLEHPHEFGYWLGYLKKTFDVQMDADDTIITYLYKNDMLIKGEDIKRQDSLVLKSRSDEILKFLSKNSAKIDMLICELPGYIGSRVHMN